MDEKNPAEFSGVFCGKSPSLVSMIHPEGHALGIKLEISREDVEDLGFRQRAAMGA